MEKEERTILQTANTALSSVFMATALLRLAGCRLPAQPARILASAMAASTSSAASSSASAPAEARTTGSFRTDHFSHASPTYANFRPTYPGDLYDKILEFHGGARDLCVDIGCGNGQATRHLSDYFRHVVGVDPSKGRRGECACVSVCVSVV
jgi:hypothetical protein